MVSIEVILTDKNFLLSVIILRRFCKKMRQEASISPSHEKVDIGTRIRPIGAETPLETRNAFGTKIPKITPLSMQK
jgi:hypothetical protein